MSRNHSDPSHAQRTLTSELRTEMQSPTVASSWEPTTSANERWCVRPMAQTSEDDVPAPKFWYVLIHCLPKLFSNTLPPLSRCQATLAMPFGCLP